MSASASQAGLAEVVELPKAPPASTFPTHPAAWYLYCHSDDLLNGPCSRRILGRDLVAFRPAGGKVAVLDARCAHLGANLGCGEVVGETIQCPYHHWQFDGNGQCKNIPGQANIPAFARQQTFPVCERHGFIFFFNGPEAFYPLPFFEGEKPDDFTAGKLFSYVADASWFMVAGQGFDRQHFESVHDRKLTSPPQVSCPSPFVRRNQYHAENIGTAWRDWLLRLLVGSTVNLTVNNWGGTMYVVKAEFPRTTSRFVVSFRPLEDGRTHFDVIVYAPTGLAALGLPLRRLFTQGHLESEARQVRNTEYRPGRLIAADADLIDCFRWLAELPQRPGTSEILSPDNIEPVRQLQTQ
jgi:phenylpropionate dioxygenase-like ring-hydroxylating dioxygenase large terminal subunit